LYSVTTWKHRDGQTPGVTLLSKALPLAKDIRPESQEKALVLSLIRL
jgi:hypothetical protein